MPDAVSPAPTDFQSVLAAVTGVQVDLRGASAPEAGWLVPGGDGWWDFAPFGSTLFRVGLNTSALTAWSEALTTIVDLEDQLDAGVLGLMDVRMLGTAETSARARATILSTAADDLSGALAPTGSDLQGNAVDELDARLDGIAGAFGAIHTTLAGPPAVADVFRDAAAALAAFGHGMANAIRDTEAALAPIVGDSLNGLVNNVSSYLTSAGLAATNAPQVLAGYSASAGGSIPPGLESLAGDLTQATVWNDASAAISARIGGELDKLDTAALGLLTTLDGAYRTAVTGLGRGDAGAATGTTLASGIRVPDRMAPVSAGTTLAARIRVPDRMAPVSAGEGHTISRLKPGHAMSRLNEPGTGTALGSRILAPGTTLDGGEARLQPRLPDEYGPALEGSEAGQPLLPLSVQEPYQ